MGTKTWQSKIHLELLCVPGSHNDKDKGTLHFGLRAHGHTLAHVQTVKYLGVTISQDM